MVLVHAGVDVPDDDRRATAGDRVRLRLLDLPHVPLQRREGVLPRRRVRKLGRLTVPVAVGCERTHLGDGLIRPGHAGDAAVLQQCSLERVVERRCDHDADRVVIRHDFSAGLLDRPRRVCRRRGSLVHDHVVRGARRTGRHQRRREDAHDNDRAPHQRTAHSLPLARFARLKVTRERRSYSIRDSNQAIRARYVRWK